MQIAIERLVYAHLLTPLPQEIDILGEGFVLCASKQCCESTAPVVSA